MATKRKSAKKSGKKSGKKRVGAMKMTATEQIGLIGLGAVTGAIVKRVGDYLVSKQTTITDPKKVELLKDGITVGSIGVGGALVVWGKHPFVQGLGIGVGVEGVVDGAKRIGVPIAAVGYVDKGALNFPVRNALLNGIEDINPKSNIGDLHKTQLGKTNIGMTSVKKAYAAAM